MVKYDEPIDLEKFTEEFKENPIDLKRHLKLKGLFQRIPFGWVEDHRFKRHQKLHRAILDMALYDILAEYEDFHLEEEDQVPHPYDWDYDHFEQICENANLLPSFVIEFFNRTIHLYRCSKYYEPRGPSYWPEGATEGDMINYEEKYEKL